MTQPPAPREGLPMRDEMTDAWAAYDALMRRCLVLEEIAERLAVTSVDPVAVADWWTWKADGTG